MLIGLQCQNKILEYSGELSVMSEKVIVIVLLILLFMTTPAFSQRFPAEERDEPEIAGFLTSGDTFTVFPERFGRGSAWGSFYDFIPSREVRALYASYDTLWIGTEGGLFAWDLMTDSVSAMENFPMRSVRSIMVDDYYRLWVGCDRGVCLRDSTWKVYDESVNPFFRRVTDLMVGSRKIWIATYGEGCGYLASDSLIVYTQEDSLLDNRVLSIAEETASEIWFGTASGVCRADSFRWESMRYGRKIPIGAVNDLIFDENRNLFIAIRQNGLARYKFGKTTSYGAEDGLPGWNLREFSLAPDGRLIAAGDGGACYYDGSGWTPLIAEGISLSGYNFFSIHHDYSGNCFLGSDEGSVVVLGREGSRKVMIPQEFPGLRVSGIYPNGDKLLLITENGLYRFCDTLSAVKLPAPWYESSVTGMAMVREGEFWVSTRFGALYFREGDWELYDRRAGLPSEYLTSVEIGPEGEIWFGTFDEGVICLKEDKWFVYGEDSGLQDNRISDLMVSGDGKVRALTFSGRLIIFEGNGWMDDTPGDYISPGKSAEQASPLNFDGDPAVRVLAEPGQMLYAVKVGVCLGVGKGRSCLFVDGRDIYSNRLGEWMKMPLPDPGYKIIPSAVFESRRSELWLGTENNGLFVFRGGGWKHYGLSSGFSGERILSIAEDSNGVIWIGTASRGLSMYQH